MLHVTDTLVTALSDAVGERHVLVDDDVRAPFEVDWTGRYRGVARAVVRPADTAEVVAVLGACRAHGAAVVPQGGNTGMVGAGVPRGGEIVLSLTRLRALGDVDRAAAQVQAGAGVTLGGLPGARAGGGTRRGRRLRRARQRDPGRAGRDERGRDPRAAPWDGPGASRRAAGRTGGRDDRRAPDPAQGQCRLRPLVAARRERGHARHHHRRPLAPRTVVHEPGRRARRTRLAGAGGRAADRRAPQPPLAARRRLLRGRGPAARPRPPRPPRAGAHTLAGVRPARVRGAQRPTEELAQALGEAGIEDAVVADDSAERERLWRFREGHTEALSAAGVPHKCDVGVPLARLAEFAARATEEVGRIAPQARVIVFGHLGDGNVHVNVLGPEPGDYAVDEAVLRVAAACGGTISAEHGVVLAKPGASWATRTPARGAGGDGRDQARARPRGAPQPGCRAAVTSSWTKASFRPPARASTNG